MHWLSHLSEYHITVNSIAPGWIENNHYEALTQRDHDQHPSRRVGKPEDIARMCLFLCHEENNFIQWREYYNRWGNHQKDDL